jgi:hypothetical protein
LRLVGVGNDSHIKMVSWQADCNRGHIKNAKPISFYPSVPN